LSREEVASEAVDGMLVDGAPKIHSVAEAVGTSVRTLQRRLSDIDTTFSAVADAAKMRTASDLLAKNDMPLTEIAHQLGDTYHAKFTRALKRIAGVTPVEFRRAILREQGRI